MRHAIVVGVVAVAAVLLLALGLAPQCIPLLIPGTPCEITAWEVDPVELEVVDRVNAYRMANGAGPLVPEASLNKAAQWKSNDMGARGYTSHDDTTGRDFPRRLAECGVASLTIGEVIGSGQLTPEEIVTGWQDSPPHDDILRAPLYNDAGIGHAVAEDGTHYWVLDVARRN